MEGKLISILIIFGIILYITFFIKIENMINVNGKKSLRFSNQGINYVVITIDSLRKEAQNAIDIIIPKDMRNRHRLLFLVEESKAMTLGSKFIDVWLSSLNGKMYLNLDENDKKVLDTGLLIDDNLSYGRTSSNDLIYIESQNNIWRTYKYEKDKFRNITINLKPIITFENNTIYTLSETGSLPVQLNLTKTN